MQPACNCPWLCGGYSSISLSALPDDTYISQRLAQVDELMRQRKVPAAMAERVHNYYNYILRRQLSSEQSFIMEGGCLAG